MINLEIPGELITQNSIEINYSNVAGKTIVGLCGYARSGKDTLGKAMVTRLGFKRISFGDLLKQDLNQYMKNAVFEDLQQKDIPIEYADIDFETPNSIEVKEILRPYMIWYGEKMKSLNGKHHWTNRALGSLTPEDTKIVITDVRRENELEIFRNNREFRKIRKNNRRVINLPEGQFDDDSYDLPFDTLLFYINQLSNKDTDVLTFECIMTAMEEWLFDDVVHVDSRIPNTEDYQERHILNHLRNLATKYPSYLI